MSSGVPISAADVAKLIEKMGCDRVISIDLHCGQIQGFFGPHVPVDNLESSILGIESIPEYLSEIIKSDKKIVIVSPDAGGVYRARKFQEILENYLSITKENHTKADAVGLAMIIKHRDNPGVVSDMHLVGNVNDANCIIVDDMIDTAGTLTSAANELNKFGANKVYAYATHGLLNGPAIDRINESSLDTVIITDTIQPKDDILDRCPKLK